MTDKLFNELKQLKTQKDWEIYIKKLLKTNNQALMKALKILYENQTPDEKYANESLEHNGIGFNNFDAKYLTITAETLKKKNGLSKKELVYLRQTLPKYWKKLMVIIKKNLQEQENYLETEKEIQEQIRLDKEQKEKNDEIYCQCQEYGQTCLYGICSECPYENKENK